MVDPAKMQRLAENWAKSSAGKAKIKSIIQEHQRTGKPLEGGGTIITSQQVTAMAQDLISMIQARLPEQIASVGGTLTSSAPIANSDGSYKVSISFDSGALFRASHETLDGGVQYDGRSNIVALFNNGYKAGGTVYGLWKSKGKNIYSLRSRPHLGFMQEAAAEFNARYGAEYNATVQLGADYN